MKGVQSHRRSTRFSLRFLILLLTVSALLLAAWGNRHSELLTVEVDGQLSMMDCT